MPALPRLLFVLLLAGSLAAPLQARLGETLSEIRKQFSDPPDQSRKGNAFWLIEGEDGLLVYTVTLNAKGLSVAEGLKPVKRARFSHDKATDFIASQTAHLNGSKTLHPVTPGQKYRYAGQDFVCAPEERVLLDEPNGLLLIWNQSFMPSIVVLGPEMFQPAR